MRSRDPISGKRPYRPPGHSGRSPAPPVRTTLGSGPSATATTISGDAVEQPLATAPTCVLTSAVVVGPYWFDVHDIREDRPGTLLKPALRVHDVSECAAGGAVKPVPNAVVEL